ncbi:transmembrane channel-like protein [Onthophagus taurus]|uniref:transmembrane channel-like protein n=1 Tax=Onthophagus taurus TaxID=166361 RepID=UPI0039BE2CAC
MKDPPVGILRTESWKSRPSSSEFRYLSQVEPTSPQPSVDRLSVTFAEDSQKSEIAKKTFFNQNFSDPPKMDKVHFPSVTDGEITDEDEDYSITLTAIMQRKASTKKSRRKSTRRTSSSFSPDILPGTESERRRSSCYTTSSGDTAISVEDNPNPEVTQDQIFENIRLHKEVLSHVKMQPWPMRKKLRLVITAKNYIKRHEGALQERFAQSHSTKDMLARFNIYLIKKMQRAKREAANLSTWLIPWELRIKEIESHFGSVVASYFTFLRWLFWVNLVTSVILIAFVTVPELLTADQKAAGDRKLILKEDKYNATNFLTLWDFEGILKYSPLFYGWYTNKDIKDKGYRLPLAYFMTGLAVYVYSFVATLRKMAENSRTSKLSEKEDECIFSWKVFTSWDYMIGNPETAANRVASIVMGFKEALLEEAEKKKNNKNWKIVLFRVFVNITVCGLLIASAYAVVEVVRRSMEPEAKDNFWRMNEITIVMTLISTSFPMIFEVLGICEQYHPRKQLRLQLARIMMLNLLNLYSLIIANFEKITEMEKQSHDFKPNETVINKTNCYNSCMSIGYGFTPLLVSLPLISNLLLENNTTENITEHYVFNETFLTENVLSNQTWNPYENITIDYSDVSSLLDNKFDFDNISLWTNSTDLIETTTNDIYNSTENETIFLNEYFTTYPTENNFTLNKNFTEPPDLTALKNLTTIPPINCTTLCRNTSDLNLTNNIGRYLESLDYSNRTKLRSLCWETMFGQELVKLTVMDLVMNIVSTLAMDFFRGVFVRVMNKCWCWDLEKKFPQYGDFKVAENILHLVNNQGMVWMGMFFSPGIVLLNVIKLYLMVYFRSWIVLTCNVPHKVVFRASRSNNFYYALLLSMLFLCVLPVGYAIVWIHPSFHCGPFSNYRQIFHIFTKTLKSLLPKSFHRILDYIASPGIVIPLLVLLILIIYYLISLTDALREANNDLKIQLRRERTEERRKMFQIVDRRRRVGSLGSGEIGHNPFGKWKKLLNALPSGKSFDETPKLESDEIVQKQKEEKPRAFISKLIKKALRKPISEDEDGTDNEQHDSLPEDGKEAKPQVPTKSTFKMQDTKVRNVVKSGVSRKNSDVRKVESPKKSFNLRNVRQDSIASNWSDNIPVITISKTESLENVLDLKQEEDDLKIAADADVKKGDDKLREFDAIDVGINDSKISDDKEKKYDENKPEIVTINSETKTESSTDYKELVL